VNTRTARLRWILYSICGQSTNTLQGFTFDSILHIIRKTALNPAITVPLVLASLYSSKGRELVVNRPRLSEWLKILSIWSVMFSTSKLLDEAVLNNWTNDVYDWKKEIVVVTGGSDGIGAIVVKLLAEKDIKVVILDIQEPKGASELPFV
jgi:all-trans-retinol dehydrogenase (NAD+)